MSGREYRIEYTIQATNAGDDWADIGFGSSGTWDDVDSALYAVQSYVQNRIWEVEPGMPDPRDVDRGKNEEAGP